MAFVGEAGLGKLVEMAVEIAVQKVAQEVDMIVNFKEDFRWLREEFTSVRALLEDPDQQSRHKDDVKQWLHNIVDISMRAEDIFEECAVDSMYGNGAQTCGFSFSQCIFRYKIGRRIRGIKARVRNITEKAEQLSLRRAVLAAADEALPTINSKRSSLLPRYSHPVGIESKVNEILKLLNGSAIPAIAVVGMGGLGKTYLLQHVFNEAKERYEKSIWLSVSQSYSVSNLQKDIASHLDLGEQISDVNKERAAELIREKLQGKRCLVVLDDVWEASREDDLLDRLGLPCGNNSSCKILVSTRSKDVCTNLHAQIYKMQYLSPQESWSLFSFYAFRDYAGHEAAQQQLEEVGRKIVKQCGNLPLAVKTVAASLANTRTLSKWESKLQQLEEVKESAAAEDEFIMGILKLSYNALSARLKACFAYLSFFPEDEDIDAECLVNLWIGEGFIPAGEQQLDDAWDCFHQLANLCHLQVWENVEYVVDYKLIKHCKIHDLLLDLAIQISRKNRCAFSGEEASAIMSDGTACCRILLAKKDLDVNAISERRPVSLRTLSLSQNYGIERIPEKLFSAMRGLRVLDLSATLISTLPASVGEMRLLKFLNLRETQIKEVPKCVKHLKSLLFLALPLCCEKLPVWISNLKFLQHLECEGVHRMPKEISKLGSLRTLRSDHLMISAEEYEMMGLEDLGNMTQLQELWLQVNDEMELKRMEEVGIFAKLLKMRRLSLQQHIDGIYNPHIGENMIVMKDLESLQLYNFPAPSFIWSLENLRELQLDKC